MKSPFTFYRAFIPLLLLLSMAIAAPAQDEYASVKKWESYNFGAQTIATGDLSGLEIYDLKLVRGIVFGKHGRVFKDPDIRRFLESRTWYKADSNFQNSSLNDTERANLDVIRIAEATSHAFADGDPQRPHD